MQFFSGAACTILIVTFYGMYNPPKCPHCLETIHISDRVESDSKPRQIAMKYWLVQDGDETEIVSFNEFVSMGDVRKSLIRDEGFSADISLFPMGLDR